MSGRGEVEVDESGETQLAKIAISTLSHLRGNAQVASIRKEDPPLFRADRYLHPPPAWGKRSDHGEGIEGAAVQEEGGVGAQIAARTLSER